ncbi:MAG: aldolase [Phycisphaerae bacterium]|nr:aldolase [Phycisphaerae bacterium]
MRPSVVKAKLARNQPVLLTMLHFTDPSVFEMTSLMGFDGIWMDLEHHFYSVETAAVMMRAARVGTADILARCAKGEFMRIGRLLEAGAQGIMYPRCDGPEEAAEAVKWAKFAPLGKRGFDGGNPDMPYCSMPMADYVRHANEQTFLLMQIEEQQALDAAEAIARVEGVDGLFFGPADYSVLSGFPGQFESPRIQRAVEAVAKAAKKTGKHWGTPAFHADHAKWLLSLGATVLCHNADLVLVKEGLKRIQEQFRPLGFQFSNQLDRTAQGYLQGR